MNIHHYVLICHFAILAHTNKHHGSRQLRVRAVGSEVSILYLGEHTLLKP